MIALAFSRANSNGLSMLVVECQNITRIRELEAMIESYSTMVERNTRDLQREKERVEKLLGSVARDVSIKRWQMPLWRFAILRAQMRLSWFETIDFTRELSPQIDVLNFTLNLSRSLARRRFDFELGAVDKIMKSRDRTFEAERLIGDLLGSFLGSGGKLELGKPVVRIEKGLVHTESESHCCRHIVVAAGRRIPDEEVENQASERRVV